MALVRATGQTLSLRQELEAVLNAHSVGPKKGFGQNFLVDPNVLDAIAKLGLQSGEGPMIEIGPGPGTLTERLVGAERRVVAIEKDPGMIPVLHARLGHPESLRVIEADALQVDLQSIFVGERPVVMGNIPYNISSPLLFRLVEARQSLGPVTLLVQREVAERWAAPRGSKVYGIPSVLLQMRARVQLGRKVGSGAFFPPPRVQSMLVSIEWLEDTAFPWTPAKHCDAVVRIGFGRRRKMLRNTLTPFYDKAALQAVEGLGISLDRRAETLDLQAWSQLAQALLPHRELTTHVAGARS